MRVPSPPGLAEREAAEFACPTSRPVDTLKCLGMTDRELLDEVRRMRAEGTPPKAIANVLGVRPYMIAPLVRQVAAERPEVPIERSALVECWISPAWSRDLIVERRDGWDDVDLGPDGPAGIVLTSTDPVKAISRAAPRLRASASGQEISTRNSSPPHRKT